MQVLRMRKYNHHVVRMRKYDQYVVCMRKYIQSPHGARAVQVLVEKLLRTTNVARLYLLIRPKRGVPTHTRLEELLASKLFDR